MKTTRILGLLALVVAVAAGWMAATALAQDPADGMARIVAVEPSVIWAIPRGSTAGVTAPRLSEFLEEDPVPERARFRIRWAPPAGGLDQGCTVLLEYRLAPDGYEGSRRVLEPGPVRAERTTLLEIPLDGRRVAAWRIQLMSGDTVLDQRQSRNWK